MKGIMAVEDNMLLAYVKSRLLTWIKGCTRSGSNTKNPSAPALISLSFALKKKLTV